MTTHRALPMVGLVLLISWLRAGEVSGDRTKGKLQMHPQEGVSSTSCEQLMATSDTQEFHSPNWPQSYPNNYDACWLVVAGPDGGAIYVDLPFLYLDSSPSCSNDHLIIRDGFDQHAPVLHKLCGTTMPSQILATSGAMYVSFHSDGQDAFGGFDLTFTARPHSNMECTSLSLKHKNRHVYQNITSPGYPNNYHWNSNNCWLIKVPEGSHKRIELRVFHSQIEESFSCENDYVEVHDGDGEQAPLLARWCGSMIPADLLSSSGSLYIHMHTNENVQASGFVLGYKAYYKPLDCHEVTSFRTYTYMTSPLPTGEVDGPTETCWLVRTDVEGDRITILANHFDSTEAGGELIIYDGPNDAAPSLVSWTGPHDNGASVVSTGSSIYLRYRSEGQTPQSSYELQVNSVDATFSEVCVTQYAESHFHTISSANYPRQYAPDTFQCWVVEAQRADHNVQIRIVDLNLEQCSGTDCACDVLDIRDGNSIHSELLGRWCGSETYVTMTTSGRYAYIMMSSNSQVQFSGFTLNYNQIPKDEPENPVVETETADDEIDSDEIDKVHTDHLVLDSFLGEIIGVSALAVAVIIISIFLVVICCCRKKKKLAKKAEDFDYLITNKDPKVAIIGKK